MVTLKLGSVGNDVRTLQKQLNLAVDGIFGPITEETVKQYQKSKAMIPDGIVGPKTWAALGVVKAGKRAITEIIVHCTATPEGQDVTINQIKRWHLDRGFNDIGYHYVIYRDGSIHQGRAEEIVGAHAVGHNAVSIGICYVGGLAKDGKTCKDTRTSSQKASLISLIKNLKLRYPTIKVVMGHRDTSPDLNHNGIIEPSEYIKACPCFDAIPEYKSI